ncbi:hypothetical protein MPC4_20124 [Methylocella tundrae]|uniref:Uncharacterized protein n=1 Tax=Methylocella tundrae TaxID=227605 RepID=A0A8B6M500_METTU|nr:hypothetical protein MPC1_830006 [Methylocella tundrae]VTZ49914.1 hypothetical protein MPC4_20124 [Methylocella tundrae]
MIHFFRFRRQTTRMLACQRIDMIHAAAEAFVKTKAAGLSRLAPPKATAEFEKHFYSQRKRQWTASSCEPVRLLALAVLLAPRRSRRL